ncbi:MAG: ribosome-associated translation inhibitor RaiA [Acidobacteriaceae bacterium]|nr:ribosome-associated translation inhibitor RaiA [Acidobacteriaceae bacterium]MBV9779917.1 ribosome-associated translation inhibitor RaiA [Acidobacteriaceae bacterium]
MKLIYSGKTKEFTPEVERKITAKLAKLSKMIEQRGEREAHVTHRVERHLHRVEIVMQVYDHALIGEAADADLATAFQQAADSLGKQIVKMRNRWRDMHRDPKSIRANKESWGSELAPEEETAPENPNPVVNARAGVPRIFRVNYNGRKPMTLDEAVIEMENEADYVVYRDSDRDCLSVLIRRRDGNFDLIES